jgi:hypothetical protein
LFRGTPPTEFFISNRAASSWTKYSLDFEVGTDIIDAACSPDKLMIATRISDKEVRVYNLFNGNLVASRSTRGSIAKMLAVHWVNAEPVQSSGGWTSLTQSSSSTSTTSSAQLILFITTSGIELYSMNNMNMKHIKTITYQIVDHWLLPEQSILMLVDNNNIFQTFRLGWKSITKICKFELDYSATSMLPSDSLPSSASELGEVKRTDGSAESSSYRITLCCLYGKIVCALVDEVKAQLYLLTLCCMI